MATKMRNNRETSPFPWWYCILNGLLIYLVWWAGLKVDTVLYGNTDDYILVPVITVIVMIVLWFASFLFQIIVYLILRRRLQRQFDWLLLFIIPATAFTIVFGKQIHHQCQPSVKATSILSSRDLAKLPQSTSEIKIWRTQFHDYLRFQATPEDIEDFLNDSSYLHNKHVICVAYSPTRRRLVGPKGQKPEHGFNEGDIYVTLNHNAPNWYEGSLEESGRVYSEYGFELIVNDKTNTVFLHLEH